LERRVRSRKIRTEDAGAVILMLSQGGSFSTFTATVGCYPDYINRWKQRFETERLTGQRAKHCGQLPAVRTPAMEVRILSKTRERPPGGSTHWSTRKLAKVLGISHVLVARVWRRAGLQPHRLERYMLSDDPAFEQKAADVMGLPCCRCRPGAPSATALNTTDTGRSRCMRRSIPRPARSGQTVPRHTSAAFVDFLSDVVATHARRREIHVIVDNLSAHKTKKVQAFLEAHPHVHLHFTPTYSSWLNQVELWFAKIERDLLARGIFTSLPDLARKIRRYTRYNEDPKPIRWTSRAQRGGTRGRERNAHLHPHLRHAGMVVTRDQSLPACAPARRTCGRLPRAFRSSASSSFHGGAA
jgi:transposase